MDNVYVIDRQTASVVTRPSAGSGRPVERVDLAQTGTLGDPASVTVRGTQAFVLNETPTSEQDALSVVEVGAPTITVCDARHRAPRGRAAGDDHGNELRVREQADARRCGSDELCRRPIDARSLSAFRRKEYPAREHLLS